MVEKHSRLYFLQLVKTWKRNIDKLKLGRGRNSGEVDCHQTPEINFLFEIVKTANKKRRAGSPRCVNEKPMNI